MDESHTQRRRFQFRLRTLMIGVTLLALASGYVGYDNQVRWSAPA
jgi:hypothetical protein